MLVNLKNANLFHYVGDAAQTIPVELLLKHQFPHFSLVGLNLLLRIYTFLALNLIAQMQDIKVLLMVLMEILVKLVCPLMFVPLDELLFNFKEYLKCIFA